MSYFRQNIDAMGGYVPGEQPLPGQKVVKLNTNENPYPPSPAAVAAMRSLDEDLLRRYPNPMAAEAQTAAAALYRVPADHVLVGNGSDDLLTMIFRACLAEGRAVAYPTPTYVLYQTLAKIQNAPFVEVPYGDRYTVPVDALMGVGAAVTIIASPNSPSGTTAALSELKRIAEGAAGILVIDEAYVDFADSDAMELVPLCENVIVLRTLSKGYSLAGLRVGFGVAQPSLLEGLVKVKDSYNVDAVACAAAAAALADQEWMIANADKVKASRRELSAALTDMGFSVLPSQSNFLLAAPPRANGGELYEALKARGILVRYFNQPHLDDKLRITVGTPEQNAALTSALKELI